MGGITVARCVHQEWRMSQLYFFYIFMFVGQVRILFIELSRLKCLIYLFWSEVKWSEVKWNEVKWVTVKFLGIKVPCILGWPYTEGTWLYGDYFIWVCLVLCLNLSCNVCVCVLVKSGCFGNMCACTYCVLYCLYCVFCIVSFIYIYIYLFLFVFIVLV